MAFQQPSDNSMRHRFKDLDRTEVANWIVQVRDNFSLAYIYTMVHDWIAEEGWGPRTDLDFPERYIMIRDDPVVGREMWIRWRLQKPFGNGFFTYMMDLDWKMQGMKDTEVSWKGQKVKMDRGEFELTCRGALLIDKEKKWESWPFKAIKSAFTKRTKTKAVSMHQKSIYVDCYRLRDMIMNYLKLETFMAYKESGEFYSKRDLN